MQASMAGTFPSYGLSGMAFKRFVLSAALVLSVMVLAIGGARAEPRKIVGLGDSLMAGYGLDAGQSFPEKLQAALGRSGHEVLIANAGVSGDTTSGGLARLDWSVPEGTEIVILELGANDMLRGIAPDITRKNLGQTIERLKARGIVVLLAGMRAAPNLGPDFSAAFDAIYPDLARQYGLAFYPFFLDGVAAEPALLLDDGMHPNAAGVERMVERFLPTMENLLKDDGA
jgi:acyl-CoA thioesterase-1